MIGALTLVQREMVRFLRQPNRLVGAVGQPLIFWVLFGALFHKSFPGTGETSAQFFLPGIAALIVLFTAIFSTISIIEDRREGFLQSVLVSPIPRGSMVMGKILGGTLLAMFQAALFLLLAPLVGQSFTVVHWFAAMGVLFLVGFGLTGLGFCIAWRMDSTQGYHAIMSVVLFPMWLLSGSLSPVQGLPGWFTWLLRINPLTYGVSALRTAFGMDAPFSPAVSFGVTTGFALLIFLLARKMAARHAKGDLK